MDFRTDRMSDSELVELARVAAEEGGEGGEGWDGWEGFVPGPTFLVSRGPERHVVFFRANGSGRTSSVDVDRVTGQVLGAREHQPCQGGWS